jgi:hypothetical protein
VNVEADVLVKLAYAQMHSAKKPELELTEAWLVAGIRLQGSGISNIFALED